MLVSVFPWLNIKKADAVLLNHFKMFIGKPASSALESRVLQSMCQLMVLPKGTGVHCVELVLVLMVSMKFKSDLAPIEKLGSILALLINDILGPLLSIIIESLCISWLNLKWHDLLYSQEWESVF